METLKYKVIKSAEQYSTYCRALEHLVCNPAEGEQHQDEVELLTTLIEVWDRKHTSFTEANPVELLQSLMTERRLKGSTLATELGVGKSLISDILNYKRAFSKEIIRKLATYFQLTQEAFNRPYTLKPVANSRWSRVTVLPATARLTDSALSQVNKNSPTSDRIEELASKVLDSSRYSAVTKTLAGSVLSQSAKGRGPGKKREKTKA